MSANYFNNAGANENVVSFKSWILWHKLNGAADLIKTVTAAKKSHLEQIMTAIDNRQKALNLSTVSFVLFY